jgi:sarcosine oxidase
VVVVVGQTVVMPDVVVIGAGMAGAATAWVLARRGRSVLLVDRFGRGHDRGSSHGAERIFRFGYADPSYVALAQESVAGWHDLQLRAGGPLLHATGAVDHGDEAELAAVHAACAAAGVRVEMLTALEASSRWPGLRFDGPVLHQPDGGRVDADRTLQACWDQAADAGAEIRFDAPVGAVRGTTTGVEVSVGDEVVVARVAVVTAAGWSRALLEPHVAERLVPPLTVTAETVAFFRPTVGPWPSFIQRGEPLAYGLGSPDGLVKAGLHGVGPVIDPDDRPAQVPDAVDALEAYARDWLPGVEPTALRSTVCLYASSSTDDFVVDRDGPIVVGVGFGGHGFKFTPAIGGLLADLTDEALGVAPAGARPFAASRLAGITGQPHAWR